MADPTKTQKTGRPGHKIASDATDTPGEKTKSREKYKSDIPLQTYKTPAKPARKTTSPRDEGEWFKSTEAAMKNAGTTPGKPAFNDKPHDTEFEYPDDLEDAYFEDAYIEDADQDMTQDEINKAYSKYIKEQLRIDIETEDAMIRSIEKEMWTIHRELKSRKGSPSWKKNG